MITNYLKRHTDNLGHDERGQMAFLIILTLPVLFIFLALVIDTGAWFFDRRSGQNQVDGRFWLRCKTCLLPIPPRPRLASANG